MHKISANQIQQQQPHEGVPKQTHLRYPLQNANMMRNHPIAGKQQERGHQKIDQYGGKREKQVDPQVLPLVVLPAKQGHNRFQGKKKGKPPNQNSAAVR
jgi:hypothetical protein